MTWVGEAETVQPRPTLPGKQPTKRKTITIAEVLPSLAVLRWKITPSKHVALKGTGLKYRTVKGLQETQTPLLKGAHQTSHTLRPRTEAVT